MTFADIQVTDFVTDVGVPITVALLGVAGALIAAALSFALGRWGDAAARRRDGYAEATKTLISYREYAWKVRRRTSDDPDELGRLAAEGHTLQEKLRYHQSWARSENRWVGRVYREVREDLATEIGPACNSAWNTPPVTMATGMCLGPWGPAGLDAHIDRFESAKEFRFGWRCLLGAVHLHLGVIPRPTPAGGAVTKPEPRLGLAASTASSSDLPGPPSPLDSHGARNVRHRT
jgi:hypothetical protein